KKFNRASSIGEDLVDRGFNFIKGGKNDGLDEGEEGVSNDIDSWKKFKDEVLLRGVYESEEADGEIGIKRIKGVKVGLLS
ncbi:CapA family protein, partial [Staphylococcus epidermidis]|uniref:CapA family protein n=1 Tax=Staphylococcus epidermidis TaxID=1282 RepID=UPI0021B2F4D4